VGGKENGEARKHRRKKEKEKETCRLWVGGGNKEKRKPRTFTLCSFAAIVENSTLKEADWGEEKQTREKSNFKLPRKQKEGPFSLFPFMFCFFFCSLSFRIEPESPPTMLRHSLDAHVLQDDAGGGEGESYAGGGEDQGTVGSPPPPLQRQDSGAAVASPVSVPAAYSTAIAAVRALIESSGLIASDARALAKLAKSSSGGRSHSSESSSSSGGHTDDSGRRLDGGDAPADGGDVPDEAFSDVLKHSAKLISFTEDLVRRVRVAVEDLQLSHVLHAQSEGHADGAVTSADPVLVAQLGEQLQQLSTTSVQAKAGTIELVKALRGEGLRPPNDRLQTLSRTLNARMRLVVQAAETMSRRLRDAEKKALRAQYRSAGVRRPGGGLASLKRRAQAVSGAMLSSPALSPSGGSAPDTPTSSPSVESDGTVKGSAGWRKARIGRKNKSFSASAGAARKHGLGDGLTDSQLASALSALKQIESSCANILEAVRGVADARRVEREDDASSDSAVLGGTVDWDELAETFVEPSKTVTVNKDLVSSIIAPDFDFDTFELSERETESPLDKAAVRLHRKTNEFIETANEALHDSTKVARAETCVEILRETIFWCQLWAQSLHKAWLPSRASSRSAKKGAGAGVDLPMSSESFGPSEDSSSGEDVEEPEVVEAPRAKTPARTRAESIMAQIGLPLMNVVKTVMVSPTDTPDQLVERVFSKHYASPLRTSEDRAAATAEPFSKMTPRQPEEFVLKVPGRPEYLSGRDTPVLESRYVSTCVQDGRRVELVMVEKLERMSEVRELPEAVVSAEQAARDAPGHMAGAPVFSGTIGEQMSLFERLGKEELAMMIVDFGIKAGDMRELFSQDTFLQRRTELKSNVEKLTQIPTEEKSKLLDLVTELDSLVERTFDQYEGLRQIADMRGVRGCGEVLVREGAASVSLFRKMMISAEVVIVEREIKLAYAAGSAPFHVETTSERFKAASDRLFSNFYAFKTGLLAETGNVSSLRELDVDSQLNLNCSVARQFVQEVLDSAAEHMKHVRRRLEDKVRELELLSLPEEVQLSVFSKYRGPVQFDMAIETEFASIRPWVQEWISVQVPSIVQREIMAPTREELVSLLDKNNRQMVAGFKGLLDGQILEPLLTLQSLYQGLCDEVELVHFAYS
jgi:PI3-kinase family, ras-binding domain